VSGDISKFQFFSGSDWNFKKWSEWWFQWNFVSFVWTTSTVWCIMLQKSNTGKSINYTDRHVVRLIW